MEKIFSKSKEIWINNKNEQDDYADFITSFSYKGTDSIKLLVACDSAVSITVNGTLACFTACADFPHYKIYNEFDITKFCGENNEVVFTVWHFGCDSQTYINGEAFLIYEIKAGGKILSSSGKDTLCRKNINYVNGKCKIITRQLGYSYMYDNTVLPGCYNTAVEKLLNFTYNKRPTNNLVLCDRLPIKTSVEKNSILIDLEKEVYGALELDFESEKNQKLIIAYGEHLTKDGDVPRIINERDFSIEFVAKQGNNQFINALRRIAGRYIKIYFESEIKLNYAGIRPIVYPIEEKTFCVKDNQLKKIYEIAVNTLRLCMHEHYEDCPWREQALYVLDSRNQMLCGYYAFKDYSFQKANLLYISKGLRKDGLLSLCFPAGIDIPIPFFSLCYILSVSEYLNNTGDDSVLTFAGPVLEQIRNAFENRLDECGLVANFPYPYWNFYEWSEHSNNDNEISAKETDVREIRYDLILNCTYVLFIKKYNELFGTDYAVEGLKNAIHKTFYNENIGLYKLSTIGENYSQLGNCFAILAGLGDVVLAEKIINCENMDKITLSMNCFFYDALLTFKNTYKQFIIEDIKKKYIPMINAGATTFWETEKGSDDFDGAGSLCHGWSSMPVYYLNLLKDCL